MEKIEPGIRSLSNQTLILNTHALVQEERKITIEVLRHLREIERRQLFAELGFPSLFSYCTKELRYSESAACRRIEAMRALRETGEIEVKLETGELNLSSVTQARSVIRQHERAAKTKVSAEKRKTVMLSLCGKSKRDAEKVLAIEFPLVASSVPVRQQEIASGTTRVTIEFTEAEMQIFDEIKRLSGQPQNLKETVLRLATKELSQLKKSRGEEPVRQKRAAPQPQPPPAEVKNEATPSPPSKSVTFANPRNIPVAIKRSVWNKAGGRCEYQTSDGDRCEARHALEYDHQIPVSCGGLSDESNLRVFCREHNALAATQILGRKIMARYFTAIE